VDSIRVFGLRRLDSLDLLKQYPDAKITFEPGSVTGSEHGELASATVILLTLAGLRVLAAWLMKNRKNDVIEHSLEVVGADGSRRIEKFSMRLSASTSQADVVKAIADLLGIDVSKLNA
jgi:hypothetical protein